MSAPIVFYSHAPVVRSESGPFVRWIDLSGGLDVYGVVSFSRDIVWLRHSQTSIVVRDGEGAVLDEGSSYSDFYGYLSCQEEASDEARVAAKRFAVTKDGPLSVEVILRIEEAPAVVAKKDRFDSVYKVKYQSIPDSWCRPTDRAFIARSQASTWEERLSLDGPSYLRRHVLFEAPIWSSRNGLADADQSEIRKAALSRALNGLPEEAAVKARARFEISSPSTKHPEVGHGR